MKSKLIIVILIIIIAIAGFFLLNNNSSDSTSISNSEETNTENNEANNIAPTNPPTNTNQNTPQTYDISIKSFAFTQTPLTIKKGDTVIWTNEDSAKHTVTSDSGNELNSALIGNDEKYSHTFDSVGTFSYHCTPHPSMKGKIIVE